MLLYVSHRPYPASSSSLVLSLLISRKQNPSSSTCPHLAGIILFVYDPQVLSHSSEFTQKAQPITESFGHSHLIVGRPSFLSWTALYSFSSSSHLLSISAMGQAYSWIRGSSAPNLYLVDDAPVRLRVKRADNQNGTQEETLRQFLKRCPSLFLEFTPAWFLNR